MAYKAVAPPARSEWVAWSAGSNPRATAAALSAVLTVLRSRTLPQAQQNTGRLDPLAPKRAGFIVYSCLRRHNGLMSDGVSPARSLILSCAGGARARTNEFPHPRVCTSPARWASGSAASSLKLDHIGTICSLKDLLRTNTRVYAPAIRCINAPSGRFSWSGRRPMTPGVALDGWWAPQARFRSRPKIDLAARFVHSVQLHRAAPSGKRESGRHAGSRGSL